MSRFVLGADVAVEPIVFLGCTLERSSIFRDIFIYVNTKGYAPQGFFNSLIDSIESVAHGRPTRSEYQVIPSSTELGHLPSFQ